VKAATTDERATGTAETADSSAAAEPVGAGTPVG
jgi:hypothetical protein